MQESLILSRKLALINYTQSYPENAEELLSRAAFSQFLDAFLADYALKDQQNFLWLQRGLPLQQIKQDLLRLLKGLLVLKPEELRHPYLNDRQRLLQLIEAGYHFWRSKQRISILTSFNGEGLQPTSFLRADNQYNQLILQFYRTLQEKVQGEENRVLRQLQAGTNAALLLREYPWPASSVYAPLRGILFINRILLRTPLLIHPGSTKREGVFELSDHHPMEDFKEDPEKWIAYPCKVGQLLVYVYFHRDFTGTAIALANLFELAAAEECIGQKPDCLLLFGNPDGQDETVYYHDPLHSMWVGKISYADRIEYFGYLKKMILTLHNLCIMQKGWLPLHGAMVSLTLKDGRQKGVVLIGDSGAGKSETIEQLSQIAKDEIVKQEIIFDDMGALYLDNGQLVAQGTEIGAFVRLDDLEQGSAYRDLDRSIFFNPESANARVVVPVSPYSTVVTAHPVDLFLYANNYTDCRGIHQLTDRGKAETIFLEGKRQALGTTQESGLCSTYFANPFGPMQMPVLCRQIFDRLLDVMYEKKLFVGEIYTCLGVLNRKKEGLEMAAESLLEIIRN